jgi:hypothetical protein
MVSGTGDSCPGAGVKEDAGTAGASVDAKTDRVPMICGRDKASSIAAEEGGTGTDACATTMPDRGPGGEGGTTCSGAYACAPSARVASAEIERERSPWTGRLVPG